MKTSNKKKWQLVLGLIIGVVLVCSMYIMYKQYKSDKYIVEYVKEHKEILYYDMVQTGLKARIEDEYSRKQETYIVSLIDMETNYVRDNTTLVINYEEEESSRVSLTDYIKIDSISVDSIPYEQYEFGLKYMIDGIYTPRVDFNVGIELASLTEQVLQIARDKVNIAMVGASGTLSNSHIVITNEGQAGRTFDESQVGTQLSNIKNRKYSDMAIGLENVISITSTVVDIKPSASELLLIKGRIASFSTGYASSGSSRKNNISIAANMIDGVVLESGQSLSVDKVIGSRNAKNGYTKSGSYLNGKTVQTYGGGVCQVSTTLYGAVLRAGIIPTKRSAHSMSVGYVPLGLDAAISEGYKDLVIMNTYDFPIYIQAVANGSSLTFSIWGNVEMMGGYEYVPNSKASSDRLKASAWVNKTLNGQVVERIDLNSSTYSKHE